MYMKISKSIILALLFFACKYSFAQSKISIISDRNLHDAVKHGFNQLEEALASKRIAYHRVESIEGADGDIILVAGLAKGEGPAAKLLKENKKQVPETAESLTIWKTSSNGKRVWVVSGNDERGVMYGLFEVADRISWADELDPEHLFQSVKEVTEQPAIAQRAVSTYTMNRRYWESRFYDEKYWEHYFDLLAKSRFNMFTIIFGYENGGFLAPCYPYFFDVESHPDVKMNGLSKEQQNRNLAAMNRIIELAHQRGIGITLGIWDHIYRGGIQAGNMDGGEDAADMRPELVSGLDSDKLIPYTADALNKLIDVMPGLDGIQFRMHGESGLKRGEQRPFWKGLFQSIKKSHPDMRLVLRAKDLPDEIIQDAINSGVNFSIETKFWMEQTGLPYSPTKVNKQDQKNRRHGYANLLRYPKQYNMYWRLWSGGTNRILTWGDHEYTSRFFTRIDHYTGGRYWFEDD